MTGELKKAKKAAEWAWELVCFYDSTLDGLDSAIEEGYRLLEDTPTGTGGYKVLANHVESMRQLSTDLHEQQEQHVEEHDKAKLKVAALEKTEKIEALRKAEPGLYIRKARPDFMSIASSTIYRYGGAGVWMANQKVIDLEDVPWPLVKLVIPGIGGESSCE